MKEIYEMKGAGRSIRGIAGELGIARNTVRRYLKSPEAIKVKPRPRRASKLDPYTGYMMASSVGYPCAFPLWDSPKACPLS